MSILPCSWHSSGNIMFQLLMRKSWCSSRANDYFRRNTFFSFGASLALQLHWILSEEPADIFYAIFKKSRLTSSDILCQYNQCLDTQSKYCKPSNNQNGPSFCSRWCVTRSQTCKCTNISIMHSTGDCYLQTKILMLLSDTEQITSCLFYFFPIYFSLINNFNTVPGLLIFCLN